jgi:hypothetical protein
VRAPVVRRIYDMYLAGGVGITQIRDAFAARADREHDLSKCPREESNLRHQV